MRAFVLPIACLLSSCGPARGTVRESTLEDEGVVVGDASVERPVEDPVETDVVETDAAQDSDPAMDSDASSGPCPAQMALVDDTFCIDVAEAALQSLVGTSWVDHSPYDALDGETVRAVSGLGRVPQAYVSGNEAAAACEASGKRLCTSAEWLSACRGPDEHVFPYGDTRIAGACNDTYPGSHPVVDLFGTNVGVWDPTHMNDPRINQQTGTVDKGGANAQCVSDWGVYDLHGNLHEWVADASGTFRGGFFADASINGAGCGYATTAHSRTYHDYSTGFRCCADPTDE